MSVPSRERPELTLADYLAVLRRNVWLILIVALTLPLAAYLWSSRQPAVYRATSEVLLSTQNLGSAVTGISIGYVDPGRFGETQAALARVPAIARSAISRAKVRDLTAAQLLAASTVAPRNDADFLTFTVDNRRRDHAARLATAYARAFTSYKLNTDTRTLSLARQELEGRLEELREQGATGGALFRDLQEKIQNLRTLELLQAPATVVAPAFEAAQIAPTPIRNAAIALVLGVLAGVAVALLKNALDRTIRTEEEIERALGLPLLARLPTPERRLRGDERLAMLDEPSGMASAEAIRILRTNIELANVDLRAQVLMTTSATPGEGKSTTIANLAIALGRAGRSVALVDLDLRQPTLATFFDLTGRPGVTEVVQGRVPLSEALTPLRFGAAVSRMSPVSRIPGSVSVLTAGAQVVNPGELIGSETLDAVLNELRATHDLVLVDAPPVLEVGDAMTLSARVDAVFVVVRLGSFDSRSLTELARSLATAPAPKLGFVLTNVDRRHAYGGRVYGQGSSGRRDEQPAAEPEFGSRRLPTLSGTEPTLGVHRIQKHGSASEKR